MTNVTCSNRSRSSRAKDPQPAVVVDSLDENPFDTPLVSGDVRDPTDRRARLPVCRDPRRRRCAPGGERGMLLGQMTQVGRGEVRAIHGGATDEGEGGCRLDGQLGGGVVDVDPRSDDDSAADQLTEDAGQLPAGDGVQQVVGPLKFCCEVGHVEEGRSGRQRGNQWEPADLPRGRGQQDRDRQSGTWDLLPGPAQAAATSLLVLREDGTPGLTSAGDFGVRGVHPVEDDDVADG